jgi:xylan 1,4-beta-xylosidase
MWRRPIISLGGLALFFLCASAVAASGQSVRGGEATEGADPVFANPIVAGFAPDPSIVRVGDDFYMVNSTFEYFPALPIRHSRDLVNWRLIGYAVTDPEPLALDRVPSSGGMQAPTIRHHDGLFYVVATSIVGDRPMSFVTTAREPQGPWSSPHVIEEAEGIDPALFFDDDGTAWYTANRIPPDPEFEAQAEIWLQRLDLQTFDLVGERYALWRGCCQGIWVEGPRIYKHAGQYVLLVAEGGTGLDHAVSVAVSDTITGPYSNNPRNPILTHRHLSQDSPYVGVGHADLVELADGRWYAVALGWRQISGPHALMGRETFLMPVQWERQPERWRTAPITTPVFSPRTGRVEHQYPLPLPVVGPSEPDTWTDLFTSTELDLRWRYRRAPAAPFATLIPGGGLRLALGPNAMADRTSYSFVGAPQQHPAYIAHTVLRFDPAEGEEAGLVVIQKEGAAFSLTLVGAGGGHLLQLSHWDGEHRRNVAQTPAPSEGPLHLRVRADRLELRFESSFDGESWRQIGEVQDGTVLSPAILSGFNYTGVHIGPYASANGRPSSNAALFERFTYLGEGR